MLNRQAVWQTQFYTEQTKIRSKTCNKLESKGLQIQFNYAKKVLIIIIV